MRLSVVEHGHGPLQKLPLGIIRTLCGHVPGPILVMSYRRSLFGKWFANCLQQGMKRTTEWSCGEVEIFAAFVSKKNSCAY
jgi:hypothetical protein